MSKILKTSAEGRKCVFRGCTRTLSIYNHAEYCHLHLDAMAAKQKPVILKTTAETDDFEINAAGDGFVKV